MSKVTKASAVKLKDGSTGKVVMVRGPVGAHEPQEPHILVDGTQPADELKKLPARQARFWSPVSNVVG